MGKRIRLAVGLVAVGILALAGCAPGGGGDPRDAPGCDLNAYRCDGDVLQVCQINATERRKTWWDVHDCVDFGQSLGKDFACVEPGAGASAECGEAIADAAVPADGADAGVVSTCPLGAWRCQDGVVQACDRDAEWRGTDWWDIWDCNERSAEVGKPIACVESDAGAACEYVAVDGGAGHAEE